METRFFLKKKQTTSKLHLSILHFRVNGETFRFSTKVSILNSQWSAGYPKR
jgi:hypothetical protein